MNDAIDRQIEEYNRQAEEFADLANRHEEQADYWKREQNHLQEQLEDLNDIEKDLKTGNISLEEAQKRLKKHGIDTEGMSMAEILLAMDKRQEALKKEALDAAEREKQERDLAGEARDKSNIAKGAAKDLEEWKKNNPNATAEEFEAKKAEVEQGVSVNKAAVSIELASSADNDLKSLAQKETDESRSNVTNETIADQTASDLNNMFSMSPS